MSYHSSLSAIFGFRDPPCDPEGSDSSAAVTHAALGISFLQQAEANFRKKLEKLDGGKRLNADDPEDCLELARLAELSGNLSPEICFYLRAWAAVKLHQQNMNEDGYDSEIKEIQDRMTDIRKREGIGHSEDWPKEAMPVDYKDLEKQYRNRQDEMFEELLLQLDIQDVANLYKSSKEEYRARFEEGRRQIGESIGDLARLTSIQEQFEKEAEACANAGAYHAAAIMISAALESALLMACIRCPKETKIARSKLLGNKPREKDPRKWTLGQLICVTTEAEWLTEQVFERVGVRLDSKDIARSVSKIRNMIHPGAQLRDKGLENTKLSYLYVREAYTAIKWDIHDQDIPIKNTVNEDRPVRTPYYSTEEDSFHTCTNCREGNSIEPQYLKYGRGNRTQECWLCELYRIKGICSAYI